MIPDEHNLIICVSPDTLQNENDHLQRVFHKNNYNSNFIKLNTYKNNEHNKINNPTTVTPTIYLGTIYQLTGTRQSSLLTALTTNNELH